MAKYCLKWQGFGKFKQLIPIPISLKEAKELKKQGYKIFNSRSEAIKYKERKSQ